MDDWSPLEVDALPEDLILMVKPELQAGERLLWAARSRPRSPLGGRIQWTPLFYALAFLGLSVLAFAAIFGPFRHHLVSVEVLMIVIGVIAAVIGLIALIVVIGSLIERWTSSANSDSVYALTDRRGIIWIPELEGRGVEVHSVVRGSLVSLHRVEYPDGWGDIHFHYPTTSHSHGFSGFDGIPDVRQVEDLARRTLIGAGSPQSD